MSPQDKILKFYAHIAEGDIASADAMIHPEFTGEEAPSLPYAGTYVGIDGWRRLLGAVTSVFTDFQTKVDYILADEIGTRLVVMVQLSGRAIATGVPFETSLLELWEFRDGLISAVRPYYWDTHLLRRVSGMED